MLSSKIDISTSIVYQHYKYWLRFGNKYMAKIMSDDTGFYELIIDKKNMKILTYIDNNIDAILFGENDELMEVISSLEILGYKNEVEFDVLNEILTGWPFFTKKGKMVINRKQLTTKSDEVIIFLDKMILKSNKESNEKFENYCSSIKLDIEKKETNDLGISEFIRFINEEVQFLVKNKKSSSLRELLVKLFNYKDYRSLKGEWGGVELLNLHSIFCCPFCGRQYITPYINDGGHIEHTGQLDHFYPKDSYPYLGLSLNNLIPICAWCNHKKLNYDSYKSTSLINPNTIMSNSIKFVLINSDTEKEFITAKEALDFSDKLTIKLTSKKNKMNLTSTLKQLHLDQLYQSHKSEIINLLIRIEKSNIHYINSMISIGLYSNRDEAIKYLFSDITSYEHPTPLSKLKGDVYENYNQFI